MFCLEIKKHYQRYGRFCMITKDSIHLENITNIWIPNNLAVKHIKVNTDRSKHLTKSLQKKKMFSSTQFNM